MNAHTISRDLLRSMQPQLPTERLSVPELVRKLQVAREEAKAWDQVATSAPMGSALETKAGDNMSACDDRIAIFSAAIIAAVDVELERIGLSYAELMGLDL